MATTTTIAAGEPATAGGGGMGTVLTNIVNKLGAVVTVAAGAAGSLGSFTEAVTTNTNALTANVDAIGTVVNAQTKLEAADLQLAIDKATAAFDKQRAAIAARNAGMDVAVQKDQVLAQANLVLSNTMKGVTTEIQDGIAVAGRASVVYLSVAAATQAQTDALIALLKEQNAYTAAIQNTLSVAKGWGDYLAQLVSGYQSGTLSLIAYKRALEDFATQLEQTFAGATGKAKDALESMIQTIQKLIATAGAGGTPSTDQSPTGALNKAFP